MKNETSELELARLRHEQTKTRHDEVFGGLSTAERVAYDKKQDRIRELERDLAEQGLTPSRTLYYLDDQIEPNLEGKKKPKRS